MKKKIKNQRSAGKIIPLHSKFTELTNDAGRDTEVLYGQKGGTPCRIGVEYKCVGDSKKVRSLHKVLKYMEKRKTTIIENGFGKWWLGNLVDRLGGDWTTFNCRGEITGYGLDGNVLTINHYTAWCEQSGLRENKERAFPSVKVYYRECEPTNCVCSTNDTTGMYFPEPYCLASFDNQPEFFMTIGEAARYISGIVRKRVPSKMKAIHNALKRYMRLPENQDMSYFFHEIRIVT